MNTDATAAPSEHSPAFAGIDLGGSHTGAVVVGADGAVLGRAEGPGGPLRAKGLERSTATVLAAAGRAAREARVTLPVRSAVVGAAGAGRDPERGDFATALREGGLADDVRVMGDGELALHAAFGEEPGIVVTAGTGSIAFARDAKGALHRAGGYGWQLGDEGGGYWLGRRALVLAARERDAAAESPITARLLDALSLRTFDDLVRWAAVATPVEVAAVAPALLQAAHGGHAAARGSVSEAGEALAALVGALRPRLAADVPVPLALGGRVLGPESPVRAALLQALARAVPRAQVRAESFDPALAAARLAAGLPA